MVKLFTLFSISAAFALLTGCGRNVDPLADGGINRNTLSIPTSKSIRKK